MEPDPTHSAFLPAAVAVYRLAFGITGPPGWWGHKWGVPPDRWAVEALAARAAGHAWRPTEPLPNPAYGYRMAVRVLMRESETAIPGEGDPAKLLAYAQQVKLRYADLLAVLESAEDRLTVAIRNREVQALGVHVDSPLTKPGFGTHVEIPSTVLMHAGRVVRMNGMLCWRGKDHFDYGQHRAGPYFADVRVNAADLRRLSPPEPLPKGDKLSAWNAIIWRAFGTVGLWNIGPRPWRDHQLGDSILHPVRNAILIAGWAAFDAAERELMDQLAAGRITISGRAVAREDYGSVSHHSAGLHARIPAPVFLGSHIGFDREGRLTERASRVRYLGKVAAQLAGKPFPTGEAFREVWLSTHQMRLVWAGTELREAQNFAAQPARPSTVETVKAPRTTIAAERKFTAWLTRRMMQTPDSSPGKLLIKHEAEAAGFTVSQRAFGRAWANAVQDANVPAWSSPGRKPKHRIETSS